jgi:hexosaminidase
VLDEVIALFPSKMIHIGGDEAPKTRWKECAKCQHAKTSHNLKDEHELQSYFVGKIDSFLTSRGRTLVGWDEILEGGLSPNAVVMSWRGTEGGIAAAKQKHQAIMTPGSHCYFDHYQDTSKNEPLAIGGFTSLEKVYNYQPIPSTLDSAEQTYILGAQANLWTEYMPTEKQVMYMLLPRLCALSEVLWTDYKDFISFENRIDQHEKFIFERNFWNYKKYEPKNAH